MRRQPAGMPGLSPKPFNRYLCAKGPASPAADSARALQKLRLRTAKYCTTSLFNSHYDELYARLGPVRFSSCSCTT